MKYTRTFLAVILGMMFFSGRVVAQEDYIGTAASALQDVLSNLKQTAEKLDLDNEQLAARDDAMKQQVLRLRSQLAHLEAQGDLLSKTAARLQDKIPSRAQQPAPQDGDRPQVEKLKLMKMIYESQQRQESLNDAIQEFQKKAPLPSSPPAADQWDDAQLRELESEVKTLEKNYLQFKNLMAQMGKKSQAARMTDSEHVEAEKLKGTMDDMNRQAVGLRADLDDLRSQMIDLDKRKSHLETMIQQSS